MAQNWWDTDPVANEDNASNWWSSDPVDEAPAADPARQELPAGVVPSAAGGGRGIVNPPLASEPQPQIQEPPGFFGRLADSFGTGIDQAKAALSSINVTAQNEVVQAKRQQLARLEASGMADSPEATGLRAQVEGVSKRQGQYIADLAQRQQTLAAAPVYQGVRDLGKAETFGDAWSIFAKDPVNIALNLGAQSLPTMAPGLIAGAINPVAGAITMGASSAGAEFGSSIMEFAQKKGVDTSKPEALASFYSNPAMLNEAKQYAATRAGIIGVADAASAGIASKTLVPKMITSPVARVATNTVAQMGVQGVSGGAGEAGAQIATEGRITSPGEVVAEIAGEFAGAPLEVAAMRANVRKERELQRPETPPAVVNFTPADSPTRAAGLPDIVVPVPTQGAPDAGTAGPVQPAVAGGLGQRGLINGASVEPSGLAGLGPVGDVRPGTDGVAPVDGATRTVGDAGVQRPAPVAGDPLKRAADTDLLQRAEAAQPAPAEQPTTIWTGRAGDGYATRGDAEVALPTRVKREPDLRWEIEQMPSGKFRLAGYAQPQQATPPSPAPAPAPTGPQLTAQQFMQNPAQAIETAQQITFAPGQMGAVKVSDRKALNGTFNVEEMDDGTTVFTRAAAPAGAPAVAGGVGQRGAPTTPTASQQSIVMSSLNRAPGKRFVAVGSETENSSIAQRIAAAFGRPIMFVREASRNAGFSALFYPDMGVVVANAEGRRPMYAAVTHEVYHGLPDDLRARTTEAVMATVTPEQRKRFLEEFSLYQKAGTKMQDEELVARIIEQDAENPQFWQKLADRMGDSEFAKLAREILGMLDRLLAGFTREDSSEFTSDIERVREVVADAYAEAQARLGEDVPDGAMASGNRRRETVGDFQVVPAKDGSMTVLGEADAIRAAIPSDVQGRVVDGGIRFTTSDAQRVRAALEGRQVAYSRAGAVLDKMPMKDGKYLGAPPDYDTPGKIPTLRKILRNLTKEGEAGRFWYENSSKAVLRMTGGNVQEARKFVALLAIYSPQAKVDTNTTFSIRAWSQHKAGMPISVKTKVMDEKAARAMEDIDAFWSGEKTGNFFFNLLREIDPTTEGKQGATIDMWMMRAAQYPTDAPTKTQYAFMENETNRIAAELGWEPQQVQAAIWVAMKARMENSGVKKRTEATSEKKGWIRFDRDAKGKKVRVIIDAQKHRDNWLAHAMRHVPSATDTKAAKFDFEDGLMRHIGQISFEARPGRTSGALPGIHSAPYAQQVEFQQAVQRTFYDERGTDMLASYLGLMIDNDILAPGVWQGEVSPSTQMSTVMSPVGGKDGKNKVDPSQAKLLNVYASVLGLLTRQEGVGWHRPFYATTKRAANGLDIDIGRAINPQETADLERAVGAWMQSNGHPDWQGSFAFISSPKGIRLVNFGIITNEMLQTAILNVAGQVLPSGKARMFASDGDMPTNNWKENPDGQDYVGRIRAEGRSDVLDWARAVLAPRVDAVFADFGKRYGWGDAGEVRFSGDREGVAGSAGRPVQAPERAAQEAALTPLPGAPNVPGFTGPDPRLVAVAEKYARNNGITLRRQAEYVQVDPERAARIAEAYEAMPHAPNDPAVREAYENLIKQTVAQYRALADAGYQFYFFDPEGADPYADQKGGFGNPWNAMRDMRANQRMAVYPTEAGFGTNEDFTPESNPLLADTGIQWPSGNLNGPRKRVLANDLFRAVHDAFGHGLEGSGFRAQGEENAWQAHVRLFTGSAVAAITSETRGQNSFLNYTNTPLWKVVGERKARLLYDEGYTRREEGQAVGDTQGRDIRVSEGLSGLQQVERDDVQVLQREGAELQTLRSQGDNGGSRDADAAGVFGRDGDSSNGQTPTGSDQQQRQLRAGQSALGDAAGESAQPASIQNPDAQRQDTGIVGVGGGSGRVDPGAVDQARQVRMDGRASVGDSARTGRAPLWKTITVGEHNRTAQVEDTVFADQKTGLMPEWTWSEGRVGDMPMASADRTAGRLDGIEAYHYSKASRQSLSSSSFGTGLQGSARDEYFNATDKRRRQRISFYVNKGTGVRPEAGVGGFAHRATLDNIYDANSDPQNLRKGGQAAFESAVLDAGFDGYLDRLEGDQPGQVILLGQRTVNVTPIGQRTRIDDAKPVPAATARKATREEGGVVVRRPDGQQMMGVIRAMPALRTAAPSFKLQYGEARVDRAEAEAANAALREAGAEFQFEVAAEPLMSSNRTQTDTPAFRKWFGDSKVVDADGKPLVVYHGTKADFSRFGGEDIAGWFSGDSRLASAYAEGAGGAPSQAPSVMPIYLSLSNPLQLRGDMNDVTKPSDVFIRGREVALPEDFGDAPRTMYYIVNDPKFVEAVKAAGYDGIVAREAGRNTYAAFRPEQIKSAIGNQGTFDPENPDIRMSANRNAPIQGSRFTLPGMDGNRVRWDKIRRALQDDALRMKRVQDAVRDAGGVVNEEQNFYDANTLMPGRVQTMMDDFRNDVIKPMIEKAAKAKIDLEELALYAYAQHAEERNNYIASINPKMPDGGSGMKTADAQKILADIAASGKQAQYDDLHQDLMSITETTRRVLLDEGLITQEQFDAMEQQYGNYIPLRGFENVDEETGAIRPGIGRGINVRGKETIKALGRASRAGDLIENVIRDYQRAVVRSEKNNVAKVLLDFVLSNPDPDLWGVDVDKTAASFDKKRGIVQYTKTIDKGEDTIGVKVAGQQVYIKLADKDLTRALKQSFKDEVSGLERATVAVSGWYNNLMRNVLTRYNPPFAMVNAIRDTQSGLMAALDELGVKGMGSFSAHLPKAIAATTADETGWKSLSNPLTQQYLREFKAAGAVTGGFFMRNLEDIAQDLRDDLLMAGATPRTLGEKAKYNKVTKLAYKGSVKFLRALELMGAASENATRFALYMAARDMGRTPAQAALLAKNGTTNFNRKGEWGGALNNLYLFFNAAVQGNAQLFKTLKNPKVAAALTGVAGLTVTLSFLNAGMGGEDDDGEKYWDKVPNYEKERNLIIMLKPGDSIGEGISRVGKRGRYIKIPVQYGLNFFPNMGYSISDVIRNAQDPRQGKTVAKAGMHMASTFFGSLNPFGGSLDLTDAVSVGMAVAPTIVDLPLQIGTERNAFGTLTAPAPFPGDTRPDSERMFISQMDGFASDLAKAMNRLGGGNEAKAGEILGLETAVTPGTIKTIIAGTTGGLGGFFEQIYDTTAGVLGDDKNIKPNRIPLLNKIYGEAGEDVNVRLAGDRMREVRAAVDVIEKQIKAGISPEITDQDRRLMSIASAQEAYNKESSRLRKEEIMVIRSTTMTPEQKRLARDNIMSARDRMATAVNRVYLNSFGAADKDNVK